MRRETHLLRQRSQARHLEPERHLLIRLLRASLAEAWGIWPTWHFLWEVGGASEGPVWALLAVEEVSWGVMGAL